MISIATKSSPLKTKPNFPQRGSLQSYCTMHFVLLNCQNKPNGSQELWSNVTVKMFYNDLAKCWWNSCATSLPESFSFFPLGPILWFIILLLEYLPIFKTSQRRQPLFESKHTAHQLRAALQALKFLAGRDASGTRWHQAVKCRTGFQTR